MRDRSHTTFTGHLRDAVEDWRKENGWSRETVVMTIVDAHERSGFNTSTGIVFDPPSRDPFERAKVNADRVFRWLDDVTKDTNPCPPNFIPSILRAMPLDRRMTLVNHWMLPLEISCQPVCADGDDVSKEVPVNIFKDLVQTSAETQTSIADLLDGIERGELDHAHAALCESLRCIQEALHFTERKMALSIAEGKS